MLFQDYLLARLLQHKQVVLFFVDSKEYLLFYHKEVYFASRNNVSESNLPKPTKQQFFMWSLIDIKPVEEPDSILINLPCFPVLTTSPNSLRYKSFLKDNDPMLTAFPLWTREELVRGYVLQFYVFFLSFEHTLPV